MSGLQVSDKDDDEIVVEVDVTKKGKLEMYSMKGGTNTLAIPATATECERTFSSAKKLVAPERNRLGDDVSKLGGIAA